MKTTGAVFFACRGRGSFGGWKVANPTTAITTSTNDDDGDDGDNDGDNDGDRRFLSASTRPWKDVCARERVRASGLLLWAPAGVASASAATAQIDRVCARGRL